MILIMMFNGGKNVAVAREKKLYLIVILFQDFIASARTEGVIVEFAYSIYMIGIKFDD